MSTWSGGGSARGSLAYDVIESTDPADFMTAATCVESDDADTTAFVPGAPGPGTARFYLVRAQNACDTGPAGLASDLTERPATACP